MTSDHHQLFHAAARDPETAARMIERDRGLLDLCNAAMSTPTLVALRRKNLDLAAQLIAWGANLFVVNQCDQWSMRRIVQRGHLKRQQRERLVEAAISAGAGREIFHAVWRRDHKQMTELVSRDRSLVNLRLAPPEAGDVYFGAAPYCGMSPLHYAVFAGDKAMVRGLLEAGAEVDAVPHGQATDSRYTPFYFVPSRCAGIAELLVEAGADVKHSAFYLSSSSKAVREVAIAHGAAGTPLLTALALGKFEQAVELIKENPEVIHDRLEEAYADTPLHMAVQANALDVARALLDCGMDVDIPSGKGSTPLAMASDLYANLEMFKLLVESGADIHLGDDAALYGAIWQYAHGHHDYSDVIGYLVEKGAKPRGLYHCAMTGNLRAAKLLLKLGADVNETQDDGWPALNGGYTPLDYCTGVAGQWNFPRVAELLRQHGGRSSRST